MSQIKRMLKKLIRMFSFTIKEPVYIPLLEGNLLRSKNILITGGSGGIGKAIAAACVKNGATVVICGRNLEKLYKVKNEIIQTTLKNTIFTYNFDISEVERFDSKIEEITKLLPDSRIDVLVNNAGIDAGGIIPETNEEQYNKTIETNLKGTYFLAQAFAKYLMANGIKGNILNITSSSGNRPVITPYMYSKWAITGLTKGLAKRLIGKGIVVNGIAPGPTATDMLGMDGSNLHYNDSPANRVLDPNEIANLAVFMISDMGKMIAGETIYITGGSGTLTFDDINYEL